VQLCLYFYGYEIAVLKYGMEDSRGEFLMQVTGGNMLFPHVLVIKCCFHSFYCMLQACEFRSNVMCKMAISIAGVKHRFENTFQFLQKKKNGNISPV
jgi:phage gp36-like protein